MSGQMAVIARRSMGSFRHWPEGMHMFSSLLVLLQAEVWDLDIIRANHSSWPVEVTNIKEGFIVVKGHSTVRVLLPVVI